MAPILQPIERRTDNRHFPFNPGPTVHGNPRFSDSPASIVSPRHWQENFIRVPDYIERAFSTDQGIFDLPYSVSHPIAAATTVGNESSLQPRPTFDATPKISRTASMFDLRRSHTLAGVFGAPGDLSSEGPSSGGPSSGGPSFGGPSSGGPSYTLAGTFSSSGGPSSMQAALMKPDLDPSRFPPVPELPPLALPIPLNIRTTSEPGGSRTNPRMSGRVQDPTQASKVPRGIRAVKSKNSARNASEGSYGSDPKTGEQVNSPIAHLSVIERSVIKEAQYLYLLRIARHGPVFPDVEQRQTYAEEAFLLARSRIENACMSLFPRASW